MFMGETANMFFSKTWNWLKNTYGKYDGNTTTWGKVGMVSWKIMIIVVGIALLAILSIGACLVGIQKWSDEEREKHKDDEHTYQCSKCGTIVKTKGWNTPSDTSNGCPMDGRFHEWHKLT